jgi:hypothetical protein
MKNMKAVFMVIFFGFTMMLIFPMLNDMFTASDGIANIVSNQTVGHPYAAFENLIWGNWHYIVMLAAGIGFLVWLLRDENEV